MKILSIIPARGGSKGIRLKNLVRLDGKPLLHYTIMASLESKLVDRTIVSTDNKKIAEQAKKFGAEVITRPKQLATDESLLEPVIQHVLDFLKAKKKYRPDIIVLLQNTSPLRSSEYIDGALSLLIKKKYDSVLSGYPWQVFSWKVKRVLYNAIHGPVLKTDHGTYAIRYASMGDVRLVEQWYRMNKAANFKEWKSAMQMMAIPMFGTGYADKEGNILYLYRYEVGNLPIS